jgi:hypothetical protein
MIISLAYSTLITSAVEAASLNKRISRVGEEYAHKIFENRVPSENK